MWCVHKQNKQRNVICLKCCCNQKTFLSFYLAVAANWERAAFTAVCKQVVIALCTVLCVLFHYVFFPQQGIFAVMTVEMFAARHFASDLFGWRSKVKKWTEGRAEKERNVRQISRQCLPLLFSSSWKETRSALKQTLPRLIQGKVEAWTGSPSGDEKGWGRIRVIHWGIFYKY